MKALKILDEEWDILIILDACRYDVFELFNDISGTLEPRYSLGSCTEEWVYNNFDRECKDIVYVSGNAWVSEWKLNNKLKIENPFYRLIEVWDWAWDEKINAVHPSSVTRASIQAMDENPDKRFIIHYLQPHSPFLSFKKRVGRGNLRDYLQDKNKRFLTREELQKLEGMVWQYVGDKVNVEEVREGYIANFLIVLEEVKKLIENINTDKVVYITSDHGEMLGYKGETFGHGKGIVNEALRKVPWFRVK